MDERAGKGHALALPARIRTERAMGEGVQVKTVGRLCEGLMGGASVQRRRKLDILTAREIGVTERVVTDPSESRAHGAAPRAELAVVDAPGGGPGHGPYDG